MKAILLTTSHDGFMEQRSLGEATRIGDPLYLDTFNPDAVYFGSPDIVATYRSNWRTCLDVESYLRGANHPSPTIKDPDSVLQAVQSILDGQEWLNSV